MIEIFDKGNGPFIIIGGENIYITEQDIEKLSKGCVYENGAVVETVEYETKISEEISDKIKQGKREEIDKIASLSDQLNFIAGTLDVLIDFMAEINPAIEDHPYIVESRDKLDKIRDVLVK